MAELTRITVTHLERDAGSIVIFSGIGVEDGLFYTFGVDHRCAQGLVDGLDEGDDVEVDVEDWQLIGSPVPQELQLG